MQKQNEQMCGSLLISSRGGVQIRRNEIFLHCPKCNEDKRLNDFGIRYMRNEQQLRNQSHCRQCRSKKDE